MTLMPIKFWDFGCHGNSILIDDKHDEPCCGPCSVNDKSPSVTGSDFAHTGLGWLTNVTESTKDQRLLAMTVSTGSEEVVALLLDLSLLDAMPATLSTGRVGRNLQWTSDLSK